jgi:hypothetical protein
LNLHASHEVVDRVLWLHELQVLEVVLHLSGFHVIVEGSSLTTHLASSSRALFYQAALQVLDYVHLSNLSVEEALQFLLGHVGANDVGVALNVVLENRFSFHKVSIKVAHSFFLALHSGVVTSVHVAEHSVGLVRRVLGHWLTHSGTHGGAVSLSWVVAAASLIYVKNFLSKTGGYTIVTASVERSSR